MHKIKIRSRISGFRRCGIPHSDQWTEYPENRWTEEEYQRLKAEPMLEVVVVVEPELAREPEPEHMSELEPAQPAAAKRGRKGK